MGTSKEDEEKKQPDRRVDGNEAVVLQVDLATRILSCVSVESKSIEEVYEKSCL